MQFAASFVLRPESTIYSDLDDDLSNDKLVMTSAKTRLSPRRKPFNPPLFRKNDTSTSHIYFNLLVEGFGGVNDGQMLRVLRRYI